MSNTPLSPQLTQEGLQPETQQDVNLDSLLLDHNGVKVYWAVMDKHDDGTIRYSSWFVATRHLTHSNNSMAFGLQTLPDVPRKFRPKYRKLFPTRLNDVNRYRQRLAYIIDHGKLTREGLQAA